jgi:predicted phage gp36 major capsid-like protein
LRVIRQRCHHLRRTREAIMTDLVQQLEHMRLRMNQQAQHESNLVAELGDALRASDHQLLKDVRTVTAEHEARRATILGELQMLAARLNALPLRDGAQSLPNAPRGILASEPSSAAANYHGADWEERSARIREALAHHLQKRAASS